MKCAAFPFFSHPRAWAAGVLAGIVSFLVYVWSLAPNVTLLDSGEFIVAAQHFGVPHPTGYPLWTLLAWAFQLLPLGNAAWEVNLFSAVCGALAVGLVAGLLARVIEWFSDDESGGFSSWLPVVAGFSFGLLLAWSLSMWSQAVIAEVYSLHALLVAILLWLLFLWILRPGRTWLMLTAYFVIALAFSNHHLSLTLAPLPILLVLLLRRRALTDWIIAGLVTLTLGYLGFAILSEDHLVLKASLRLFYVGVVAVAIFAIMRRGRARWAIIALLPFAIALGLLPYAYMPVASSTNPPMNWGYPRDPDGFFYSINRSQYSGSLSDQSLRLLGPVLGPRRPPEEAVTPPPFLQPGRMDSMRNWVGFFWSRIATDFTAFGVIGYFASLFLVLRRSLAQRTWIYLLHVAFLLAAFLQPMLDGATIDESGWWLQMPYHTYTNLIFAILSGAGLALLILQLCRWRSYFSNLVPFLLVLPFLTVFRNEPIASQRDRWFGWEFGHEMLKDLPEGSVVIGGTDPGRFVPTYMIFGESPQTPSDKRDPSFDRSDLYIITQNALGEKFYMNYLRDHYGTDRPKPASAFERWLGRENHYPEKPLVLPTEEEIKRAIETTTDPATGEPLDPDRSIHAFASVFQWIWRHNKDRHEFFVEESFPMKWTYPYAVPHGLIYRMNPEPLDAIPPESIEQDTRFWAQYTDRLTSDPRFADDYDAQRSFSKLRNSIGNIYRFRGMDDLAEAAYRQALQLWPANPETLVAISEILWQQKRFDDFHTILEEAFIEDPHSTGVLALAISNKQRKNSVAELSKLRQRMKADPDDKEALLKILEIHAALADSEGISETITTYAESFRTNTGVIRTMADFARAAGLPDQKTELLRIWQQQEPTNERALRSLAAALLEQGATDEAISFVQQAVEAGGTRALDALRGDPVFLNASKTNEPLRKLISPALPSAPAAQAPGGGGDTPDADRRSP